MNETVKKFDLKKELMEWVETVVWAAVMVSLVFTFLGRPITVSGSSMYPTYHDKDRVIVSSLFHKPQYGDAVALVPNIQENIRYIKRVIATGGQTVDINFETGEVTVDGVVLDEPYINEPTYTAEGMEFPATVPEGHVFVLGDNRNHSKDSRHSSIGMVDERQILGRVLVRFFPFNRAGIPH